MSWQDEMSNKILKDEYSINAAQKDEEVKAQMVFCIDTRSEAIRRHVEAQGEYDTYGVCWFFWNSYGPIPTPEMELPVNPALP